MRVPHLVTAIVAVIAALPIVAAAQTQAAPRKLAAPSATYGEEFTSIQGVRELKDGRVVVIDAQDKAIHVIDLKAQSGVRIGRDGDGPGEFRLPLEIWPAGGDSAVVRDMGRFNKLMVITAKGEIGGFVSTLDSAHSTRGFVVNSTDEAGRMYELAYVGPADSNSIVRWDRARGRRDTVARIWWRISSPIPVRVVGNAPRGFEMQARAAPRPFAALANWAVAPDGRVAVVTPDPYRVSYVNLNGVRITGPEIPFTPVPVTEAEKDQYRAESQRPVATLTSMNGVQTTSYRRPRYEEPDGWPPTLPAFLPKASTFASDGMLWVKRSTKAGAPALFDVFDRAGKVAYQLELPAGRKLIGFGAGSVYLARVDSDDLHYLERYRLPTFAPVRP